MRWLTAACVRPRALAAAVKELSSAARVNVSRLGSWSQDMGGLVTAIGLLVATIVSIVAAPKHNRDDCAYVQHTANEGLAKTKPPGQQARVVLLAVPCPS